MTVLLKFQGIVALMVLCLFTGGCKQDAIKPVVDVAAKDSHAAVELLRVNRSSAKATMLKQLLEQAERALNRRRLTEPSHDNAFDKFKAAQLIERDNLRARSGLDAVQLDLVGVAREYLAKGQLTRAQRQIKTLQEYFPGTELTLNLKADLERAYQSVIAQRSLNEKSIGVDPHRHRVPEKFIRADSKGALQWFKALAETIKETDSSVLIHARSDSEGRWIYKALRKPVPGYLVRGDIRISKITSIQLLEPLSE